MRQMNELQTTEVQLEATNVPKTEHKDTFKNLRV